MRILDGVLVLSPSDLSNFLSCRHRAGLDLAAVHKVLTRPTTTNPYAAILQKHGEDHEDAYVESLRARGLSIANARPTDDTSSAESSNLTIEAMHAGLDVIVQARLSSDRLAGYADILMRVPRPSALGSWSYEAHDTKLTRETKAGTILQLSAYSHLLGEMQGVTPECFHVVTPVAAERYRVSDYAAYYRMVRRLMAEELDKGHERLIAEYYPEPIEACQVCAWAARCEARRRRDDHLSYIAGSSRSQRVELIAQTIQTLAAAAQMPVPVGFKPSRGARETYDRLGNQARVQDQQRTQKRPIFERLPLRENEGLYRLPAPSPGDVFLDLEGASFAREGGREYLFGVWTQGSYRAWWAVDDAEEKAAFDEVVELLMQAWHGDPNMHVYHFNHYEPTAFKKLMGRYAIRVDHMERLLRSERFVDLYPIVRQTVRAGVESYSIKQLEQYCGYKRLVPLENVRQPLLAVELALDANSPEAITAQIRTDVQGYNEDDCRSTESLRDWLESIRSDIENEGQVIPRPGPKDAEPHKKIAAIQRQAEQVRAQLIARLPSEASDPDHPDHPWWLLAYLVDAHRREVNAEWWEYYRLRDLPEDELFDEGDALAGLTFVARLETLTDTKGKPTGKVIDRYSYPSQEMELRVGNKLKLTDETPFGEIVAFDRLARVIDVNKTKATIDVHPSAVFSADVIGADVLQESVIRLAEHLLVRPDAVEECGAQLLFDRVPRLSSGSFVAFAGESAQDLAVRIVTSLDRTTLPIQGPPGAGKTFIGAQMILALVKAGKKVGVTALSHKVIRNLLDEVSAQAKKTRTQVSIGHKPFDVSPEVGDIREFKKNEDALDAIASGTVSILGGTSFLWARPEFAASVDVLFVDEAGQMSLANVLAVSQAANSLVLLGDPQQLDQPQKASHPDGVGVSALEHVLRNHETMPPERGIFLPVTWRMSPTLTSFTSELFYEGKLTARAGLDRQALVGVGAHAGSQLWLLPVNHDGNQTSSIEEVDAVERLVKSLLAPGARWVGDDGSERALTAGDIRVVAAFNAQVARLQERLGSLGVPVGTVDKFQGQTCAVVIYSMATSRPEDAPRGLEFLYSLNRLNVATSRARCAVFLVASPRLLEPECRTPRQMQLANALCRYVELAQIADLR